MLITPSFDACSSTSALGVKGRSSLTLRLCGRKDVIESTFLRLEENVCLVRAWNVWSLQMNESV